MADNFHQWLSEQKTRSDTVGWVVRLLWDTGEESPLFTQLEEAGGVEEVYNIISVLDRGKIKSSLLQAYEEYFSVGI